MTTLNHTHDPALTSWVESANQPGCDFPIQNLPFAIFKVAERDEAFRAGVAIGDQVLDLAAVSNTKCLDGELENALIACCEPKLNSFMQMGLATWSALRSALSGALASGSELEGQLRSCLIAQTDVVYDVPAQIGDYTDFYTSINHASNIGKLFRPDNPLLPNYQWVPIGYHGRSSSIGISGHSFHRPQGQLKPPTQDVPTVEPCKRLDYELEVGIYIGEGNDMGSAINIENAENHVFGLCVFNDWSARDIQAWEYQPLGPFLSKSFVSTVSPWIVTMEALAPFRAEWTRPEDHPQPLPYLESSENRKSGAVDMNLQVLIETEKMRSAGAAPSSVAISNFSDSYWTIAQMVAHHTVNGCNLQAGDFFGSGTQSGNSLDQAGSLIESTQGGQSAIELNNGEQRTFLEDGDTVIMRAYCEAEGATRIGFGEAIATVLPTKTL